MGGEAPSGRGTFFRLQVSERTGISLVQVDKRSVTLSFRSVKRLKNGQQMRLMAVKKSRKSSGLVIYSYCKNSEFTAAERDAKFYKSRYVKGIPFFNIRYAKGVPFLCQKWYRYIKG